MTLYQVTQERVTTQRLAIRAQIIEAASHKLAAATFIAGKSIHPLDDLLVINLDTREAKSFDARAE
jgi:hypothetical protein